MGSFLIDGVLVSPQKRIDNPKGDILHALKRTGTGFVDFGEAYFSIINPHAIKGWKRHHRVTLNLIVPVGEVRFVIFDDRPDSATTGVYSEVILGGDNHSRLTVPPGLWLAFQGRDDDFNLLLNIADEEHDPSEADNVDLEAIAFDW